MVKSGSLKSIGARLDTKNELAKMSTDRRIGKFKDRLGWIKKDGLKVLQNKLKMRLNNNTRKHCIP